MDNPQIILQNEKVMKFKNSIDYVLQIRILLVFLAWKYIDEALYENQLLYNKLTSNICQTYHCTRSIIGLENFAVSVTFFIQSFSTKQDLVCHVGKVTVEIKSEIWMKP